MLNKGIIVSIQGYSKVTTSELIDEAIAAGAVAIRTDKNINGKAVPIIGLRKQVVNNARSQAFITPTIPLIEEVAEKADYVAVDYRRVNKNLSEISAYCEKNNIKVVADIRDMADLMYIKERGFYYTYIATTLSVLVDYDNEYRFAPNIELASKAYEIEKDLIAEGNIFSRKHVKALIDIGIKNVCIGAAISNVYKLTKKFTTVSGY